MANRQRAQCYKCVALTLALTVVLTVATTVEVFSPGMAGDETEKEATSLHSASEATVPAGTPTHDESETAAAITAAVNNQMNRLHSEADKAHTDTDSDIRDSPADRKQVARYATASLPYFLGVLYRMVLVGGSGLRAVEASLFVLCVCFRLLSLSLFLSLSIYLFLSLSLSLSQDRRLSLFLFLSLSLASCPVCFLIPVAPVSAWRLIPSRRRPPVALQCRHRLASGLHGPTPNPALSPEASYSTVSVQHRCTSSENTASGAPANRGVRTGFAFNCTSGE